MGRRILGSRAVACLLYAAAALAMIEITGALLSGRAFFWPEWAMMFTLVPLPVLMGTALLSGTLPTTAARVRAARACLWTLLAVYALLLLYLLFLSRSGSFLSDWDAYWNYSMVNFRPFATIWRYLRALRRGVILLTAMANLLGNLALFMPMGVLLPLLFPAMRRFWRFLLVMLGLLLLVEATQLVLRCGSCDVDDVLLNLLGAVAGYVAIRIPLVDRWLRRNYYLWTPEPATGVSS